ncbi:hypothetical protein P8452_47483 [Trifolium repens]|nr:hypothetical protein P8452_47483 [Trifolium repens]
MAGLELWFDPHKLVVSEIVHLIRSHLEEGKPSWKQLSGTQRNAFFDLFQKRFTWPPEHNDGVRRNFEKRGAAKMDQSWVGGIAQSAYEKFKQKKQEISSQNTFVSGEDEEGRSKDISISNRVMVDLNGLILFSQEYLLHDVVKPRQSNA